MKITRILSLLLCLALLVSTVALASCKKKETTEEPKENGTPTEEELYRNMSAEQKFATSILKAGDSVEKWEDIAAITKVLNAAAQSGSVQLQLAFNPESVTGEKESILLDAKLWANGTKYALNANASIGTETLNAKAYIDPADRIVLESEKILGGAYGINMAALASDLSAMMAESGEAMTAEINAYLEAIPAMIEKIPQMMQNRQALTDKEVNLLVQSIVANATLSSEEKTIYSMDREIAATCITVTIDNNAIANIIGGFYNAIKDDPDIGSLINEMMAMSIPALAESADGAEGIGVPGMVDPYAMMDQEIGAMLEGIRSGEPFEFSFVVSTDALGTIVRIDTGFDIRNMPTTLSLEIAEADNDLAGLRLTANMTPQEGVTVTATVNVSVEKTADRKIIRINTAGFSNFIGADISGTISYDKKEGFTQIRVEMTSPEAAALLATYEVNFLYKISDGTFWFGNLEVKANGEVLPIPQFMLTIKENDTMPAAPQDYRNILKMSEEELDQLSGKVMEALAPYEELFEGLFGGGEKTPEYPYNPDNPSEAYVWTSVTVAKTPDQEELLNAGYDVYECPAEGLSSQEEWLGAEKGSLTSVIGADHFDASGSTSIDIFYFKTEAQAQACYKQLDFESDWYQYKLEGSKITRVHVTVYENDPWDNETGLSHWTVVTEPKTEDEAYYLELGYTVYVCPDSLLDDLAKDMGLSAGAVVGALKAEGKDNEVSICYFASAELAKSFYTQLSEWGADMNSYNLAISGSDAKIIYTDSFSSEEDPNGSTGEDDEEFDSDYMVLVTSPKTDDEISYARAGYSLYAGTDSMLRVIELSFGLSEGSVEGYLVAKNSDSEIQIIYFASAEIAKSCDEKMGGEEQTQIRLIGAKIVCEMSEEISEPVNEPYVPGESEEDDGGITEITEPQTADQRTLLNNGYTVYLIPASEGAPEGLVEMVWGDIPASIDESGNWTERSDIEIWYFESADQASAWYKLLSSEEENVRLSGSKVIVGDTKGIIK